jgi:hypothetical protein
MALNSSVARRLPAALPRRRSGITMGRKRLEPPNSRSLADITPTGYQTTAEVDIFASSAASYLADNTDSGKSSRASLCLVRTQAGRYLGWLH